MSRHSCRAILVAALTLSAWAVTAAPVWAVKTLVIQNGLTVGSGTYEGTETTWLNSGAADTSYGVNGICRVGFQDHGGSVFRSLVRFGQLSHWAGVNLPVEPEEIISARLVFTSDTSFEGSGVCELRLVDPLDEEWTEMYCTWNHKRTDYGPVSWHGGGGLDPNYGPPLIDSVSWTAGTPTETEMSFDLDAAGLAIVRDWISGDNTSGGFMLVAEVESGFGNNYLDLYSEQTTTGDSVKPRLEISYAPVARLQIQEGLTVAGEVYGYDNGGTESTWINYGNPTWTGGGLNQICRVGMQYDSQYGWLSKFRTLMRFGALSHWVGVDAYADLGFPPGAITGVSLIMTTDSAFEGMGTCEVHVVNPGDQDWAEGYCNWNSQRTDYVPALPWGSGAGLGEHYSNPVATFDWDNETPRTEPVELMLDDAAALDVVKDWISGDNTSGTFLLKAADETGTTHNYLDFYSENTYTAPETSKPMLEIRYVPTELLAIQDGLEVASSTYDGTASAWIRDDQPNVNLGLNSVLRVGYQYPEGGFQSTFRGMIRFEGLSHWAGVDLGFEADQIVAAQLVLTTEQPTTGQPFEGKGDCELRIMNPADEDWTQMYCTWNKKRFDMPGYPDLDWDGGPGLDPNGVGLVDSKYWKAAHTGMQKVFDLEGAALEVVRGWVSGTNTSGSFLLAAEDEAGIEGQMNYVDFYSEQTSAGDHLKPMLRLYYSAPEIADCAAARAAGLMLKADLDEDCRVGLSDVAIMAQQWLACVDPQNVDCQNW